MIDARPTFITFDVYGTLIDFRMSALARTIYGDRLAGEPLDRFIAFFEAYRRDEALGPWKPYRDVILNGIARACRRMGLEYDEREASPLHDEIPNWDAHPDVPDGLRRLAMRYKLVALTNATEEQVPATMHTLGVPFHAVFTSSMIQSYKPRMQGFEAMLDGLGCQPEDIFHVSASLRYDLMTANDLGIRNKAFVNRGSTTATFPPALDPSFHYYEVRTLGEVASLLGV